MQECCSQEFRRLKSTTQIVMDRWQVIKNFADLEDKKLDSDCEGCRKLTALMIMYLIKLYSRICLPSDGSIAGRLTDRLRDQISTCGNRVIIAPPGSGFPSSKYVIDQNFESCQKAIQPRSMSDSIMFYRVKKGFPRDLWIGIEERRIIEIMNHPKPLSLLPDPRHMPLIGYFLFANLQANRRTGASRFRSSTCQVRPTDQTPKDSNPTQESLSPIVTDAEHKPQQDRSPSSMFTFRLHRVASPSLKRLQNADSRPRPRSRDRRTSIEHSPFRIEGSIKVKNTDTVPKNLCSLGSNEKDCTPRRSSTIASTEKANSQSPKFGYPEKNMNFTLKCMQEMNPNGGLRRGPASTPTAEKAVKGYRKLNSIQLPDLEGSNQMNIEATTKTQKKMIIIKNGATRKSIFLEQTAGGDTNDKPCFFFVRKNIK